MPAKTIVEIRILPPLAIARLGSSPDPLGAYSLDIDNPIGYRKITPAPTLVVNDVTGEVVNDAVPNSVSFKDANGDIRPVAPFLEVWARVSGSNMFVPLTLDLLKTVGLDETAITWTVSVGNVKAFRRTGDANDKIEAVTPAFNDHAPKALLGQCPNFKGGKSIPFGSVRYIKPSKAFPQIRLRFTPASGKVYGPNTGDPNIADDVYDAKKGKWLGFVDPSDQFSTAPSQIFANDRTPRARSLGYLDDECDGIVDVQLKIGQKTLVAFARIVAGPPQFAPDGLPIRTVLDDLEQAALGPNVNGLVPLSEAESIVRRAMETVRLMNTAAMNSPDFNSMANQDTGSGRAAEPIFDPNVADGLAIRARHESVLLSLSSNTLAWFSQVLRRYDMVGDLTDEGRRKMPGMMRGADGSHLALTRRQAATIDSAAITVAPEPAPAVAQPAELEPTNLSAIRYQALGNPLNAHPRAAIANAFPGLEMDFRNVWRRVFEGIVLHECNNIVVDIEPGAPAKLKALRGQTLISVNGMPITGISQGPRKTNGPIVSFGQANLEWSNSLADAIQMPGKSLKCVFHNERGHPTTVTLKVRPFFQAGTGAINRELVQPGELTQSLCSPWQNDYLECACYYWAASRPDYVNVEAQSDGTSAGHNWMQRDRGPDAPKEYISDESNDRRLLTYDELFRNWEHLLHFEIGGKDSE